MRLVGVRLYLNQNAKHPAKLGEQGRVSRKKLRRNESLPFHGNIGIVLQERHLRNTEQPEATTETARGKAVGWQSSLCRTLDDRQALRATCHLTGGQNAGKRTALTWHFLKTAVWLFDTGSKADGLRVLAPASDC